MSADIMECTKYAVSSFDKEEGKSSELKGAVVACIGKAHLVRHK